MNPSLLNDFYQDMFAQPALKLYAKKTSSRFPIQRRLQPCRRFQGCHPDARRGERTVSLDMESSSSKDSNRPQAGGSADSDWSVITEASRARGGHKRGDCGSRLSQTRQGENMPNNPSALLSNPSDFGTFGRYVEVPADQKSPEMRDAYDFTKNLRGLVPGPTRFGWPTRNCRIPGPPRRIRQERATLRRCGSGGDVERVVVIAPVRVSGPHGRRQAAKRPDIHRMARHEVQYDAGLLPSATPARIARRFPNESNHSPRYEIRGMANSNARRPESVFLGPSAGVPTNPAGRAFGTEGVRNVPQHIAVAGIPETGIDPVRDRAARRRSLSAFLTAEQIGGRA